MNIGVLASHEGTTLQAILDACETGTLGAQVSIVISNNSESGALRRARASHVKSCHMSGKTHPHPLELDQAIYTALTDAQTDVVFLAGYMKKLGPLMLRNFTGRILNTHPALLPKYGGPGMYGMNVHRAVLAAGDRMSGASVHIVEAEYDTGPVVAQRPVVVAEDDSPQSLAERVQACERVLIVDVLRCIARGDLTLPIPPDTSWRVV